MKFLRKMLGMSDITKNTNDTVCCPVIVPNCNMYASSGLTGWSVYVGEYHKSHKLSLDSNDYEYFDTIEEAVAYVDGIMKAVHELSK